MAQRHDKIAVVDNICLIANLSSRYNQVYWVSLIKFLERPPEFLVFVREVNVILIIRVLTIYIDHEIR